jgi:hypothetical protein
MGSLEQFFDPQQPPPPAVDAPQDAGLLQRITKLVEFATRNGPSFVELIKSKQKASAAAEWASPLPIIASAVQRIRQSVRSNIL